MEKNAWVKEIPLAITVVDCNGTILEMNDKAIKSFEEEGGEKLIGKSLFDCHSPNSNEIIKHIIESGEKRVVEIEKSGVKNIDYITPWFKDGKCAGIVELSFEIPTQVSRP